MKTFVFMLLLLIAATATAQTTVEVDVPPGDLAALRLAMDEAAVGDPNVKTVIYTSGTFNFSDAVGLPDIHTEVLINGVPDPIIFISADTGPNQLVVIKEEGQLQLQNIELRDFNLNFSAGLFVNHGTLKLLQVQFDSVAGHPLCRV
ncbi:MAG: hypothetical protein DRQ62_14135, partial [Gammaproteobacteria bacterium]